jgi:hypothetical protein
MTDRLRVTRHDVWRPPIGSFDSYAEHMPVNTIPRTRATISIPATTAIGVGWSLFWRSLWPALRGRSVDFWLEGEE